MKKEIERARESIKEYRLGYGQSQLPTDCIIQLMMGHAKSEQLRLSGVVNQKELLIKEQASWLMRSTTLSLEAIVEFEHKFKQ